MPKHKNERHWMFDENSVSYKRRLVTDASGDAYGFHRPGYRFLVDAPTTDAIDEAYRNYLDDLSSAWKGKRSTDDRRS
jgi:hypothetical protein